ncbi:type I-F CRISPR-associated endonuclease Cas1f [Allochromatium tepidum]|uniref:CRISPR-associated endonuclease Cas1 n=1 Tax=Allochromatium tepidum TaxID=553982 RepID=A0ABM7QRQ4_9GAMM|nr:type I-F CRISPR-associated endonuclease Cas1f [Allochromatium tepidum]BCU08485.1 hypothetical protein Atep_31620 [Allochromatium tepidum]
MKQKANYKPKQILLSKRANVFYLEHARVLQKDGRIIYLTDTGEDVEQYFNIPERNTIFLMLGKGTSITDAAVRRLSESNVIVGFCGSGGSPLFAMSDPVFLLPQSEYRPTEYMQAWVKLWFDEKRRLDAAKALLQRRIALAEAAWRGNTFLLERQILLANNKIEIFKHRIDTSADTTSLLLAEADWAKSLYASLAAGCKINHFTRNEGQGKKESISDRVNSFLDHGNYIAYGYAAAVLNTLGISFSFPILHGKTRRGALVFDVADLIKDAYVMPLAFECGLNLKSSDQDFRSGLIEVVHEAGLVDLLFDFVKEVVHID